MKRLKFIFVFVFLLFVFCGCNEKNHTHEFSEYTVISEATCIKKGSKHRFCKICNQEEVEEIDYADHKYGEYVELEKATCTKKGSIHAYCSVCNHEDIKETDFASHKLGEYTTLTEPTCKIQGSTHAFCSECGYEDIVLGEYGKHKYGEYTTLNEAKCNVQGSTHAFCSECGNEDIILGEFGDHKYGEYTELEKGTCIKKGTEHRICEYCQNDDQRETTYGDHKYGEYTELEKGTCIKKGTEHRICEYCKDEQKRETTYGDHKYGEYTELEKATCIKKGSEHRICEYCKNDDIRDIGYGSHDIITHELKKPTFEEDGSSLYYECKCCNKLYSDIECLNETTLDDVFISKEGYFKELSPIEVNTKVKNNELCIGDCVVIKALVIEWLRIENTIYYLLGNDDNVSSMDLVVQLNRLITTDGYVNAYNGDYINVNCVISKLISNNSYTEIDMVTDNFNSIEHSECEITTELLNATIEFVDNPTKFYSGTEYVFKVTPDTNYEIDRVVVNGNDATLVDDDSYVIFVEARKASIKVYTEVKENLDSDIVCDLQSQSQGKTASYDASFTNGDFTIYNGNNNNNSFGDTRFGKKSSKDNVLNTTTGKIVYNKKIKFKISGIEFNGSMASSNGTNTEATITFTKNGTSVYEKTFNMEFEAGVLNIDLSDQDLKDVYLEVSFKINNYTTKNGPLHLTAFKICNALEGHIHEYTIKDTSYTYMRTSGDCNNNATYYYSCSCGAHGDDFFELEDSKEHWYQMVDYNDPTYLEDGYYEYECYLCGDIHREVCDMLELPNSKHLYKSIQELYDISSSTLSGITYKVAGVVIEIIDESLGNIVIKDRTGKTLYVNNIYDCLDNSFEDLYYQVQLNMFVVFEGNSIITDDNLYLNNSIILQAEDYYYEKVTKSLYITKITGSGSYATGNYGSSKINGYYFVYYRTYNNDLLTNKNYKYDSLGGRYYNTTGFGDISKITITYKSTSDFYVSYSEDFNNFTKQLVPFSATGVTIDIDLYNNDYFMFETGNSNVTINRIEIYYDHDDQPQYTKLNSGDNEERLNPVRYSGTLVDGVSSVDVPIEVSYNNTNGTYTINKTKKYTYYSYSYVCSHPEIMEVACMIDPIDVINYYIAFNELPCNYCLNSSYSSVFNNLGTYARQYSVYDDSRAGSGYPTKIAYNGGLYYEFDIDLNNTYVDGNGKVTRGVGRVVMFLNGFKGSEYDNSPVAVYTDDHYASFQEYLNDGTFGVRFSAENIITAYKYSAPTCYND